MERRIYRGHGYAGLLGSILITFGPTPSMSLTFDKYLSDEGACNALIASAIAVVAGVILYFVAVWINPRVRERSGALAVVGA